MDALATLILVFSILFFVIFVLVAATFAGLWLTEIGLWIVWVPMGLIFCSVILVLNRQSIIEDEINLIFLGVGSILNFITAVRLLIPFFKIKNTNLIMQQAMKDALGEDYLEYVDPKIDSNYIRAVRFNFFHYLLGVQQLELARRVSSVKDIVYYESEEISLKLNVYYPNREGCFPTIVFIHGGGFVSGSKDQSKSENLSKMLANYGYTVFNVDYRLAPLNYVSKDRSVLNDLLMCDMAADIRKALLYAKNNASKFKGNPRELFVFGRSAGGHLALLTAFSCLGKFFELDELDGNILEHDIKGVIAFYPPTDFSNIFEHYGKQNLLTFLLKRGAGGTPEELEYLYQVFSPITYVNEKNQKQIPPVFLASGEKDRLVVPEQSYGLYKRLQQLEIPSVLLRLPWANHGFDIVLNGPGGQLVIKYLTQFLVWVTTKNKLSRIEALANKHGLSEIVSKEKYALLHKLDDFDCEQVDEEDYNKQILDKLYQEYQPK